MFQDINAQYCQLYSALYASRSVLPEQQYRTMVAHLFDAYRRDTDMIIWQSILDTAKQRYELRYKLRNYVPRGAWIFANKTARRMQRACVREFRQYLAKLDAAAKTDPAPPADPPESKTNLPEAVS